MAWHVILCDELGEDFSVTIIARDIDEVRDTIAEQYPESDIVSITSRKLSGAP